MIPSDIYTHENPVIFKQDRQNPKEKQVEMPTSLQLQRINTANAATSATPSSSSTSTTVTQAVTNYQIVHPSVSIPDDAVHYHTHAVGPDQSCSAVSQAISAPVSTVWSVVRRFDNPQAYKHFLKSCQVIVGDGNVGTLREVHVVSGLPAGSSTERLEILDDERHIISFSVVGGDHRLNNYRSVTTLHQSPVGAGTVVIESYVVDVPTGNTKEETCVFVDTIVRCNLQWLARIAEDLAKTKSCKQPS